MKGRILLVDDEEIVLRSCQRILRGGDYEIDTARDGLEALHVFRRGADRIQLVLLDLSMPYLGGQEALQAMKTLLTAALLEFSLDQDAQR